jgi:8-oxo-dGTP diphosphatase
VIGILGIIRRGGRLLMIQRSKTVRAPLTWCFPGGHIEPGETQVQALVREMQEELHLEVTPGEYLMTQTKHDGRLVLHCWSANIVNGEPTANPREVADVLWMTPHEIREKDGLLPGTTDILDGINV